MKITIVQVKNLSVPKILCDHCGQEIKEANLAIAKWSEDTILIVHKGACDASTVGGPRYSSSSDPWPWVEFDVFMIYLLQNMGVDIDAAKVRAGKSR